MKNPIKPNGMFATPDSIESLQAQVIGFEANLAMMLTWNYLSARIDSWIEEQQQQITLVMGGEASHRYSGGENRSCRLALKGDVNTYSFSSPEDISAVMDVLFDLDGWDSFTEFEPSEQKVLPSFGDWDNTSAMDEGWAISVTSGTEDIGRLRIERLDEAEIFDGDPGAWNYVVSRARAGSEYHQQALKIVFEENPTEADEIQKATGYQI